jgi:hypothetical protein
MMNTERYVLTVYIYGAVQPGTIYNSQAVSQLRCHLKAVLLQETSAAQAEYQRKALWSELDNDGWTAADKVAHFIQALEFRPDLPHFIDRLATALLEAQRQYQGAQPPVGTPPRLAAASDIDAPAAPAGPPSLSARPSVPPERFRDLLLHYSVLRGIFAHPLQRPLSLVPGLTARPWWDQSMPVFSWLDQLLRPDNIALMQRELRSAMGNDDSNGDDDDDDDGSNAELQREGVHHGVWAEVHLVRAGRQDSGAAERYPGTVRLLRESGVEYINARLSVLRGPTHISPHCGVSNAKLRVHVGLRIPSLPPPSPSPPPGDRPSGSSLPTTAAPPTPPTTSCTRSAMRVGGTVRRWREGGALIFDDSFEHEVWWRSSSGGGGGGDDDDDDDDPPCGDERVVLILDVFHPELSEAARQEIRAQLSVQQHSSTARRDPPPPPPPPSSTLPPAEYLSLPGGYRVGDRVHFLRPAVGAGQSARGLLLASLKQASAGEGPEVDSNRDELKALLALAPWVSVLEYLVPDPGRVMVTIAPPRISGVVWPYACTTPPRPALLPDAQREPTVETVRDRDR